MFKIFKKLKELEARLDDIYNSEAYAYYISEYNEKFNKAFEKAKEEILTYKPKCYTNDGIGWEETSRIYSSLLGHHRWVCNGIWFNENYCKTLDTLYDNRVQENLKEYPKLVEIPDPDTSKTETYLTFSCPTENMKI